jgi:hypothetical protein
MRKILLTAFVLILACPKALPISASVPDWQKGVSIYPRGPDDFGSNDMKNLLDRIVADNANFVTFVIPYYQGNHTSSKIFIGVDTPTDESIIAGAKMAHDAGLSVMLKPHLDSDDTIWRANINPTNRDEWFANYENMLVHYAMLAQEYGIEQICIGTELISVTSANVNSDNTGKWQRIISDIRKKYNGKLTYSANWGPSTSSFANEKDHIQFWGDLDYIGISAYFELTTKDNSVESITRAWSVWDKSDILPLSQKYSKPILFTEVGYRSSKDFLAAPYDFRTKGVYDPVEQANAYEGLFEYWQDKSYMAGVSMWDFYSDPNAGGSGNTDYTPQNKPAEQVLKNWFGTKPETSENTTEEKRSFMQNVGSFFRSIFSFHLG